MTQNGAEHSSARKESGNRERILKAATEHFLEKGYDGATTDAICKSANITKPTLYYYSKTKRHLFYQLHMEAIEKDLRPHIAKVSAIEDPLERLGIMIQEFAEMMCARPELRILIHETLGIRDDYFEEVRKIWKEHYRLLRDTMAELQGRGIIRDTDKPSRLALLSLGMLAWIPFWYDYGRREGGEVAASAVRLILDGLIGKDTARAVPVMRMSGTLPRGG
jgi:AcrR family transcriptional regulator